MRPQLAHRKRDLALFNLAIDRKLRGCDLVQLQVNDVHAGDRVRDRVTIIQKKTGRQQKTGRSVQFEITEQTRASIDDRLSSLTAGNRVHAWVTSAGLDSSAYVTHSMRRTKAAQIYERTGNLRVVQLLLGHTKLESTVRYLGIEVDDALSISEQVEL